MQEIIEKRTQLLNYFFNEEEEYSKLDILNKEYAALSFSPREEFIDLFQTGYEDILASVDMLEENHEEIYLKGIIVDVDNKKGYSIIHIQNKADNISIMVDESVQYHYGKYFEKGHVILVKAHTFNSRVYMHFLIDYSSDDTFLKEHNYIDGLSQQMIDEYESPVNTALIKQAKYFKSKKGNNCLRLVLYEKGKECTRITCSNLPKNLVAGRFINYIPSGDAFANNVQEIQI